MATVIAGGATGAMNLDWGLDIGSLAYYYDAVGDTTFVQLRTEADPSGWFYDNFWGSFTYSAAHDLTGGVINRWQETVDGDLVFDIRNISVSVETFFTWVENGDDQTALRSMLAGDDSIAGSIYGDRLRGHDGADTISGGAGHDVIGGGEGRSYLRGDDGDDSILGGGTFDDINGNQGADTASGGGGGDWVVGGQHNDRLYGDDGDDIVYGNLGIDTCEGGTGADIVRGGQDNDLVLGQGGNDWLSGDRGSDTVTGGAGADIFHTFSEAGVDRVTDFNRAEGDRVMVDPGTTYTVVQSGADTVINMSNGQMTLVGVQSSSLTGDWIFGA